MWNPELERKFIESTDAIPYANISCVECTFSYEAFFKKTSPPKCPKCGGKLESNTPQGRNAPVANFAEAYALEVVDNALRMSKLAGLEAKREVVCEELGLSSRSGADIAVVEEGKRGRVYEPKEIRLVFEVKMSIVWNWESSPAGEPTLIADYDGHKGRGSIYRTDSILKAIGKGAIFRSHRGSDSIPYIVLGNCPPPSSYISKIDGAVTSGIIQRFVSLTPQPLISNTDNPSKRNPKASPKKGFVRVDSVEEFSALIADYLRDERVFFGSMISKKKLGRIIRSLDTSKDPQLVGEDFISRLNDES